MTSADRLFVLAIFTLLAAVALGILWANPAEAQTGLVVPGDVDIGDDLDVTDDVQVDGDSNCDGTTTLKNHSSSYLPQRFVIPFDESAWTNKAYPDTFVGMTARTLIYAPMDGTVIDFYFAVETAGTGWDSLLLDIKAGASADSTVLDTLPMITPAVGDKSNTLTEGRRAATKAGIRDVAAGEHIRIWGKLYGSSADPPTGLKAWLVFQPDYGN